tara:strand:+ start:21663 stop:22004 length:342 start_codon:yes stop_codon:yes gene_type:complete
MYVTKTIILENEKSIFAEIFNLVSEKKETLINYISDFYSKNKDINSDLLKIDIFKVPCDIPEDTIMLLRKHNNLNTYVNLQYRNNKHSIPLIVTLDEEEYEEQNIFISKIRFV